MNGLFEFFLKYPRSVYSRGQFALLGAWPRWVLALLIVAAAAGLAWLIRSRLAQAAPVMRSWRAWVIWGLQTLMAAMLLVLLWQPAITVAELKPQQNIIAVLVDDSRSMAHHRRRLHPPGSGRRRRCRTAFSLPEPLVSDAPLSRGRACPPASRA